MIQTSAFIVAQRYVGIKEVAGMQDNPLVVAMLQLEDISVHHDEMPWCSAFANWICWNLGYERSKSLAARSWLQIGAPISAQEAIPDCDIVIVKQSADGPDASVANAPGHVGFFAGWKDPEHTRLNLLAGNQRDSVCILSFPVEWVLGFRRLAML